MILKDVSAAPVSYDPVTREHRDKNGLVEQPDTRTNRAQSFVGREDEWERFCAANEPDDKLRAQVMAHVEELLTHSRYVKS